MSTFKHFIRYGTNAEKKFIQDFLEHFNGIVFNANMVSMYAGSIASFLYKSRKEYFIDPLTHAFAHSLGFLRNEKGEIKKSLKKLAEHYKIDHIILEENRPLKAKDFQDETFLKTFFDSVINFQKNIIHDNLEDEWKELVEFLGFKNEPSYIIVPYFYMDINNYKTWKEINIKFIELAQGKYYSQIVISKELLKEKDFINEITYELNKTKGVFYWIDNFDETKATKEELKNLLYFVEKIKVKKINLYGGYFSQLLKFKGLNGVVHGLEYGESREVVPVGGGIPVAKYYLPAIKKRLNAVDIIEILYAKQINTENKFYETICYCKKCKEIKGENIEEIINEFLNTFALTKVFKYKKNEKEYYREYPIPESKINSLYHYLYVKNLEFEKIKNKTKKELLEELEKNYQEFESILPDGFLDYLKNWKVVLDV